MLTPWVQWVRSDVVQLRASFTAEIHEASLVVKMSNLVIVSLVLLSLFLGDVLHTTAGFALVFHDLLLRSYLYHCVWSGITGRISLHTTVIDNCHKHVCIWKMEMVKYIKPP